MCKCIFLTLFPAVNSKIYVAEKVRHQKSAISPLLRQEEMVILVFSCYLSVFLYSAPLSKYFHVSSSALSILFIS
jgi:hypothetical protein